MTADETHTGSGVIKVNRAADESDPFQLCRSCGRTWTTWESFAGDSDVRLIGLQAGPQDPDLNLLVFEHRCGSSISVRATRLRHLVPDAESKDKLYAGAECRGHCRRLEDLAACDRPCINARDRKLILVVQHLKKAPDKARIVPDSSTGGDVEIPP